MASIRTSLLARRLCAQTRFIQQPQASRVFARYASHSPREVTDLDLASFHAFLESHPTEAQLNSYKDTTKFRDIATHLKSEGATDAEIDKMMEPVIDDPGMNGGYVNPPAVKRSLRDPYEDWWDKQERRNFGEPVHEDNDMLGVFSLEEYNQWSAGKAIKGFLTYGLGIAAFSAAIYYNFPAEKPAVPRTFPNGLKAELGGDGALTAASD